MGLKSFLTGSVGLLTVGGVAGAFSASKRIDGVEPIPDKEIDKFFSSFAPTCTAVSEAADKANTKKEAFVAPPLVLRAYRVQGLMPSHDASVAAFGGRQTKSASYIRSDGAKITKEKTDAVSPVPSVAALYGLQALQAAAPVRRRALADIFYQTFRISDMYHYITHITWGAKKVQEDILEASQKQAKRDVANLVQQYTQRSIEIEDGRIDVALRGEANACALIDKTHVPPPQDGRTAPTRMIGARLHRAPASDASAQENPRTVMVDVLYAAPNPYACALTSSPYEIQLREWCAEKYGRLLAASVAASLAKL